MGKTVLSIQAHPDDAEFTCAGTLALLHDRGWRVHIATMTPGDCGSAELSPEEIGRIRRGEAAAAAELLDGNYHCLECKDVFIMYDTPTLLRVVDLLRRVKPDLVFAPSPRDYFVDHENTSRLVWTGCFSCGMPNVKTGDTPPHHTPHLYYVDAMEGKDILGEVIRPAIYVDIGGKIDLKQEMLRKHDSQRSWLLRHHGMDKYTEMMRTFAAARGAEVDRGFAEGFRQHLGHGFPQDDQVQAELAELVIRSQ